MNTLPVEPSKAMFTGMGAARAITLGVLINHDPVTAGRFAALSLIIGGVRWPGSRTPPELS